MKKLLFCLQTMLLGGVEKELITILKKIHREYDITVLLLYAEDKEILKEIPDGVKVQVLGIEKEEYYGSSAHLIQNRLRKGKFLEAASLAVKRGLKIGMTAANIDIRSIPEPQEEYDVAVCYHIHAPLIFRYVAQKVKAKKKVAWIHNDFFASGYPIHRLKSLVVCYDEFVAVSRKVEQEFRTCCPWYRGGIATAYNYMDAQEIVTRSQEPIDEPLFADEKKLRILTVGRFSEQKGIDTAIRVCAMLKSRNLPFHWFLIGHGALESEYRRLIKEYDVADCFTILGKKTNPYPYMRQCDICVQPSRHEAYPLVVLEAKILKRPIICTDFDGADEQLDSGRNGIIVPLNDAQALCDALAELIVSPEKRQSLTKELEQWHAEDDLREIVSHL